MRLSIQIYLYFHLHFLDWLFVLLQGLPRIAETGAIKVRNDSSGGVAAKMADTPFGLTSVQTNRLRMFIAVLSPLLTSIHFNLRGRLPERRIASLVEKYP